MPFSFLSLPITLLASHVLIFLRLDYYQQNWQRLIQRYDDVQPEDVHSDWIELIRSIPGLALDIGAGSGRDARWLNNLGWKTTAIEPCAKLREYAQKNSPKSIRWIDDTLPRLNSVTSQSFDLVLVSAVWMHLTQSEQELAYQRMLALLSQNGLLVITWRNRDKESNRQIENVDESLLHGATIIESSDKSGRDQVRWKCATIKKSTK